MKSILITGSNRGIGLGLVKALIKSRTIPKHIIATCRQPNQAKELQNLAESNKNIHILQLDGRQKVWLKANKAFDTKNLRPTFKHGSGEIMIWGCTDAKGVGALNIISDLLNFDSYAEFSKIVATIVKNDGINVLINNAGVGHKFVRIGQVKSEPLIDSFFINCVAPIMMSKEMLPFLKQAAESNSELPIGVERAAIINISSSLASIADNNDGGYYAYRCSKAALNAATKSLSIDVKPYNILANCLHPGWVKTRMGGSKAPLEVDDACNQIINTIQNFSNENTGRFYSYNGEELKW